MASDRYRDRFCPVDNFCQFGNDHTHLEVKIKVQLFLTPVSHAHNMRVITEEPPMLPVRQDGQQKRRTRDVKRDQDARKIATMLSRGNVLMQAGSFETEQDVDAHRRKLKNYEF